MRGEMYTTHSAVAFARRILRGHPHVISSRKTSQERGIFARVRPGCRIYDALQGESRYPTVTSPAQQMLSQRVMLGATCIPTPLERRRPLPGDALVPEPVFASTHAITIAAPPAQVWPWIAQMGAGRAGWYSWDAIDNGGTPSSTRNLRGIQRRSTAASAQPSGVSGDTWRKALLVCGVASSLLYASMIWGIRYAGYSPISQVPSELTAIGAPTQALWARLGWIYTVLITAFGIGVLKAAGQNRAVRIVGGLILAYASLGLLWPFAPMHQREVLAAGGGTLSDTLHVVLGAVTAFLMFLAIGFGAAAFGKRFRVYSVVTIVVLLVFGGLTFLEAPRVQMNLPTPRIGLWERINISVFLLWVVTLAAVLWPTRNTK